MSDSRTFEEVKAQVLSAHSCSGSKEKVEFYNTWAEKYEQDVAILDYNAPFLAAECIASHFTGEKESAVILDVACGTGLVSGHLKKMGFRHFVGVDASEKMLNLATKTGLYQELKKSMLYQDPFPVQDGGFVCMTTRGNADNFEYKTELERVIRVMEEEKKWSCVAINEVANWEKAVSEHERGYITGVVYLYQRAHQV